MTDSKSAWKVLSFRDDEEPVPAKAEERTAHIRQRAMEKFHLRAEDFNPSDTPSYPGTMPMVNIENGGTHTLHVFELQISKAAAERLSRQHHHEILMISDIVERPPPDQKLPPYKKPKGPKIKW
ncbi:MAG: hypothetical protein EPN97_00970 [Alphaproteobacteria bacterium]|nr:MAG: hypothetical protein EPN97_00970 [Alphaproteobacteria bacterium]